MIVRDRIKELETELKCCLDGADDPTRRFFVGLDNNAYPYSKYEQINKEQLQTRIAFLRHALRFYGR